MVASLGIFRASLAEYGRSLLREERLMSEPSTVVKLSDLVHMEVAVEFRPWFLRIYGWLAESSDDAHYNVESKDESAEITFHTKDVKEIRFTRDGTFTIELEWGETS